MLKHFISESMRCRIADIRGRGVYSDYPDRYCCIFIHIPKAAGSSIAQALFGANSRHLRYTEYEKANSKKFHSYFKFSFVRNPWSRLYSAYSFLKKGGMNEMDSRWAEENLGRYSDFESFVKGWVNEENIWSWVHFIPQHYFICDDALNIKMDFVGRFEQMDTDIAFVQQRLGMPLKQLSKVNATSGETYSPRIYTKETRDIVERVYAKDIELFHYNQS